MLLWKIFGDICLVGIVFTKPIVSGIPTCIGTYELIHTNVWVGTYVYT